MNSNIIKIADAAVEINEILKYAPLEYRLKIPSKYRIFFNKIASISKSKWKYDKTKKLYEQDLSKMTKTILIKLNNNIINNNM